jgi:hypothetical protein
LLSTRANVSFDPPGGYGTMIVTGFEGNGSAIAGVAAIETSAAAAAAKKAFHFIE